MSILETLCLNKLVTDMYATWSTGYGQIMVKTPLPILGNQSLLRLPIAFLIRGVPIRTRSIRQTGQKRIRLMVLQEPGRSINVRDVRMYLLFTCQFTTVQRYTLYN